MTDHDVDEIHSLELFRLLKGGYAVRRGPDMGPDAFRPPLAAFSTLDGALKFIKENIMPNAKAEK